MQPLGLEPTCIDCFNLVLEVLKTPQCQCHPYSQPKMSAIAFYKKKKKEKEK